MLTRLTPNRSNDRLGVNERGHADWHALFHYFAVKSKTIL